MQICHLFSKMVHNNRFIAKSHLWFHNFVSNLMSGLAAYCFSPKKPMLQVERKIDNQLTIFLVITAEFTLYSLCF